MLPRRGRRAPRGRRPRPGNGSRRGSVGSRPLVDRSGAAPSSSDPEGDPESDHGPELVTIDVVLDLPLLPLEVRSGNLVPARGDRDISRALLDHTKVEDEPDPPGTLGRVAESQTHVGDAF